MADLTLGIAFIAGLVSFISPCVLPLVPAYVGYMGGHTTTTVAATAGGGAVVARNRFNTVLHGMFFVLGFTFVFVAFGLLLSAGSLALRGTVVDIQEILARLGGLIIIIFGLHVMGQLPRFMTWVMGKAEQMNSGPGYFLAVTVQVAVAVVLAWALVAPVFMVIGVGLYLAWLVIGGAFIKPGDFWLNTFGRLQTMLYMDTRQQMQMSGQRGYMGSAVMGVVFSAGWTPCIGPVYGAVLSMAATGESLGQAGALLAAYSLGLGVPFLLTALALDQMQGVMRRLQRHMHKIEIVSGVLLIIIGLLVMTGSLQQLSQVGASGDFALNLEHCVTEVFAGHIEIGEFGACMEVGLNYGVEEPAPAADPVEESPPAAEASFSAMGGDDGAAADMPEIAAQGPEATPVSVLGVGALGADTSTDATGAEDLPDVGLAEGFLAPDFETVVWDTQAPISLRDLQGQVVVINFWATWCGPCRAEMPHFQAAYEAQAGDGFELLAINRAEGPSDVAEFQEEFDVTFPLLLDQDEAITATLYQVTAMPTTFVLDEQGVIVARHFGPLTAEQLDGYLQAAYAASAG